MWRRVSIVVSKELHQLTRDPLLLGLFFWLFTICIAICSSALSLDVENVTTAVADLDQTPASRQFVDRLDASRYFDVVRVRDREEAGALVDRGRAHAAIEIPAHWARRLMRGGIEPVSVVIDGSDLITAETVRGYIQAMVAHDAAEVRGRGGWPSPRPVIQGRTRVWYNPELESVEFMVVSMIAINMLLVGVIHPAASLVREKETGTIEQLAVSPLRMHELVAGKATVTLLVSAFGVVAGLGLMRWYDVPVRGSLALLFGAALVFQVSSVSIGALIASVSKSLQQALLLSFFGLIPMMFLSGTIVPVKSMPSALQLAALASPLTYFVDILVGVTLRGAGLEILWSDMAAMAGLAAVAGLVALWRLRRAS